MKVTYIHHSAVSVETEHSILLFDYFKGEMPDFDREKPLFVFASHFHEDHYSPVILSGSGTEKAFPIFCRTISEEEKSPGRPCRLSIL